MNFRSSEIGTCDFSKDLFWSIFVILVFTSVGPNIIIIKQEVCYIYSLVELKMQADTNDNVITTFVHVI